MIMNHKWTDIHYLYLCSTDKICGLIFAPHNTNVTKWILCQNSVKRNKTAYIVNCHVEQCQEYSTLQRWINLSLIHMIQLRHMTILSCGEKLLGMCWNFAPQTISAASATNMMFADRLMKTSVPGIYLLLLSVFT